MTFGEGEAGLGSEGSVEVLVEEDVAKYPKCQSVGVDIGSRRDVSP